MPPPSVRQEPTVVARAGMGTAASSSFTEEAATASAEEAATEAAAEAAQEAVAREAAAKALQEAVAREAAAKALQEAAAAEAAAQKAAQEAAAAAQAAANIAAATVAADKAVMKDLAERRSRLEQLAEGICKEMMAEMEWVAKTGRVGMLARERDRRRGDLARAEPRDRSKDSMGSLAVVAADRPKADLVVKPVSGRLEAAT